MNIRKNAVYISQMPFFIAFAVFYNCTFCFMPYKNLVHGKNAFCEYLLKHCEFVEIRVKDLSEAFQMFDSQNGRGKELEAYNLLKAYHIRAMDSNTFDEKIACDIKWEGSARYQADTANTNKIVIIDLLKQLINEQLYRTRLWSRKETAWGFDKKQISEFKGVTINKNQAIEFPYQNKELLQFVVQNYFESLGVGVNGIKSRFKQITPKNINPFVLLNQNIINGKAFFEYVESYVEVYKRLFHIEFEELHEFKEFIKKYCSGYPKSNRSGDRYLFELYKSLIILFFDKFGEDGVMRYYKVLYLLVYRLRIEKEQVRYAFVANYPVEINAFFIIQSAKSYSDLSSLESLAFRKVDCNKNEKVIIEFFRDQEVTLESTKKVDLTKYGIA